MMAKEEEGELSRESMAWTLWQVLSPLCCCQLADESAVAALARSLAAVCQD